MKVQLDFINLPNINICATIITPMRQISATENSK